MDKESIRNVNDYLSEKYSEWYCHPKSHDRDRIENVVRDFSKIMDDDIYCLISPDNATGLFEHGFFQTDMMKAFHILSEAMKNPNIPDNEMQCILKDTFFDALQYMNIENIQFEFKYEGLGERFKSLNNSAEVDAGTIYINCDWANYSYKNNRYDLYYLMAHEARHIYQHYNIEKMDKKQKCTEQPIIIQSWKDNFNKYIRNEGQETFTKYVNQPVEVDANAFACFYCLIIKKGDPRIPDEANELTIKRLYEIAEINGVRLEKF